MAAVPAWTLENASTSSDSASSDSHTPMILGVSERGRSGVPRRWAAANVDRKRYRDSPSDEDEDVTVEKDLSQSRSKIRTMKSRMKARKTVTSSSRSLKPLTPSDRPVDSTSVPAAHVGDYNLSKKQLSFTPKKKSRVTASNTTATPTSSVPVASVTFDIHNDITVEIPPAIYQPAKSNPPSTNKPPSNRSLCEHASIPTNSPTPSSSPLSSPPSITTTPLRQQQQAPYSPCPVTPTHSFMPSLSQRSNLPSELLSSPSPPPTDEAVASFLPEIAQLIWVRISKDGEISEDGELWWPAQVIALKPDLKVSLCGFHSTGDRTTLKITSAIATTSQVLVTLSNALRRDKTLKEFLPPNHLRKYRKKLEGAVKEWLDDEDLYYRIFGEEEETGETEGQEEDVDVDNETDELQDDLLYLEEWKKAMTRHEEQHRMTAESCPAGTLVLYRRGVYRSDWWPGEILGVAEFKPIPQAKKRKGLVSALCALEVLPAHSFKIMNFEGKHLTATKEYFYTMFENGFYEVPLGRIKPVMRRGSQHPSSQPPREPTFPAPTYGTFDGTPISHLLPYVLPIMKLIIKDLYMPIRENVDDWYQDPASRALRGKQVRYGMFERRGETEVLVDEIARILLGVGKAREDLLCEDAGGGGSGDEDSSNDDKILGKQTGEHSAEWSQEDKRQGEPAAPSSSLATRWTQPSSESYDESHQSSRTCIDGLSSVSMEVDVGVNDDGMTPDSVVGTRPSLVPGERTTASSLPNTSRIIGSLRYEQLTDVARHQFVVDIVVKEVIIQLYLWRENIRTSLQTLNDDEENALREQGIALRDTKVPFDLYTQAKAIREIRNATKAPPVPNGDTGLLPGTSGSLAEGRSSRILRKRN